MRWQRAFHVSPILLTVLVSESLIISCTKQLEEKIALCKGFVCELFESFNYSRGVELFCMCCLLR